MELSCFALVEMDCGSHSHKHTVWVSTFHTVRGDLLIGMKFSKLGKKPFKM